jgi:hypothetical protein
MTVEEMISKKELIKELRSHLRYFKNQLKSASPGTLGIGRARGRILEINHILRWIEQYDSRRTNR